MAETSSAAISHLQRLSPKLCRHRRVTAVYKHPIPKELHHPMLGSLFVIMNCTKFLKYIAFNLTWKPSSFDRRQEQGDRKAVVN